MRFRTRAWITCAVTAVVLEGASVASLAAASQAATPRVGRPAASNGPNGQYMGIGAASPTDVWAVGEYGSSEQYGWHDLGAGVSASLSRQRPD
jgi:hypothetical protein